MGRDLHLRIRRRRTRLQLPGDGTVSGPLCGGSHDLRALEDWRRGAVLVGVDDVDFPHCICWAPTTLWRGWAGSARRVELQMRCGPEMGSAAQCRRTPAIHGRMQEARQRWNLPYRVDCADPFEDLLPTDETPSEPSRIERVVRLEMPSAVRSGLLEGLRD